MLYLRCPTCRNKLGDKQLPFEKGLKEICNNENISEEDKRKKKYELLDKIGLKKDMICCRMRILTYINQIEFVS